MASSCEWALRIPWSNCGIGILDFWAPSDLRYHRYADIGIPISSSVRVSGEFVAVLASDPAAQTFGKSYSWLAAQVRSDLLSVSFDAIGAPL